MRGWASLDSYGRARSEPSGRNLHAPRPFDSTMAFVRVPIAIAALAALALAAPAVAGAQWAPAQTLSREHFEVRAGIGFTARGASVVSWGWQDGIGNGAV